jgi:hypothetical protein
MPNARYRRDDAGRAMHVFTHPFDYIALGILIAMMVLAAAKAIPRRR